MKRGGFRRGIRGGFSGRFRRPYGRFWGRPYRPFMRWRPFWWYPIWWRPLYWMPWTMMMGGFMYLLYDSMAYKMYADDVQRIEQETGKPARDLSEKDLLAAMRRLGIKKLELTPEDKGALSRSRTGESRYCIYCGNTLSSEEVYCERCGRKIELR